MAPSTCLLNGMFVADNSGYQEFLVNYYRERRRRPTVVVEMLKIPLQNGEMREINTPASDSFVQYLALQKNYSLEVSQPEYRIWCLSTFQLER